MAGSNNEVIDVIDYHIFDDASKDASKLHNTLREEVANVLKAKSVITSDDVFMGDIADSCENALEILESRMNSAIDNFGTVVSYFDEVSKAYRTNDKKASYKVIALDDTGSMKILDVNENCIIDSKTGMCWPLGKDVKWTLTSFNGSDHHGIDIATNGRLVGMDVYCAKSGVVVACGANNQGYGNWVKIQHDDGTYGIYGHFLNDQPMVSVNQRVEAGEPIGQLGSSGNSSGPHLHFEMRGSDGYSFIDPLSYYPDMQSALFG